MSIPILSLIIAALAVFFGPLISWHVAKRQIDSAAEIAKLQIEFSAEVANKQIIAPMRQAWINSLRDLVAELTGDALYYVMAEEDESKESVNFQRLTFLENKIQLMLNPNEEDHQKLEWMIHDMMEGVQQHWSEAGHEKFTETYPEVMKLCREVLKREWHRVKDRIEVK